MPDDDTKPDQPEDMRAENARLRQALDDVSRSRDRLAAQFETVERLLQVTGHGINSQRADGRVAYISRGLARLVGEQPDRLAGRVCDELPDHVRLDGGRRREIRAAVERDGNWKGEIEWRNRDGGTVIFDCQAIGDGTGGYLMFFADATEKRRIEEDLRFGEARLAMIARAASDGLWEWDLASGVVHYSERLREISGVEEPNVPASEVFRTVHPDDRAAYLAAVRAHLKGETEILSCEFRIVPPDGRTRWLINRGVALRHADGVVYHMIGTIADVTDARRAEEALRKSEERHALVARGAREGIWDWDVNAGTVYRSARFLEILGLTEANGPDESDWDFQRFVHPDDRPKLRDDVIRSFRSGEDYFEHRYRILRADGEVRHVRAAGLFIRDGNGRVLRQVGSFADVTDRILLEQRLRQAQKMEAIGQLSGGIAHDFNNLLAVIIGNLDMMREGIGTDETDAMLDRVIAAADRGAALTHQLLTYSRRQTLNPRATDVNGVVTGMLKLLRRTISADITIEWTPPDGLWLSHVDTGQLENALLNLVINARDALRDGGRIRIEAANVTISGGRLPGNLDLRPGDYVRISVADDGIGMAAPIRDRALEPFFTTKDVGQGSGLGLPMVFGFVKQSGGEARLDSAEAVGTTVTLWLPRAIPVSDETNRPSAGPRAHTAAAAKILLIEDDEAVADLCRRILESAGYRVLAAQSAPAAFEALDGHPEIALVLSDVALPGRINGADIAVEILRRRPGLPYIFMSGYAEQHLVRRERLKAGTPVLAKPFHKDSLLDTVARMLASGGPGGSP
ncbi:PAS domain-containing hybrid sensor histidine kinase/response regulator [Oceanibacterium hippocampi]|uniref:histidine kinase n=1 Tax=Oceanibacterium hippocampi TaxID=745714 RepID=A0A1Y5SBZ9_9PROT|nr:PAS domain-containing protein [Oceanibacterium hippocampi]SLN36181.1 Blue-light-activated protein [Oceanibacterium hippocampi]